MKINRVLFYAMLSSWWYCCLNLPKADPLLSWNVIVIAMVTSYIISSDINDVLASKKDRDPPEF